jgi:uncharacterized membrane protein
VIAGERRLDLVGLALSGAGVVLAGYLTLVHYRNNLLVCGISSCHTVQASKYAEFLGVPVALLGLVMYVTLVALGVLRLNRPGLAERATLATFAVAFVGVLFSAYLTAVELWVIDAICQWCVVSAVLVTVIAVIEGVRVWRILGATALQ